MDWDLPGIHAGGLIKKGVFFTVCLSCPVVRKTSKGESPCQKKWAKLGGHFTFNIYTYI